MLQPIVIKTHGSVSCGPRNLGRATASVYFTGVKKTPFSRICSSTLLEQKHRNEIFCVNSLRMGHLQLEHIRAYVRFNFCSNMMGG